MAIIPESAGAVTRAAVMKFRQRVVMKPHRGQTVVQKWPRKRGKPKSALQQAWVDRFKLVGCLMKSPDAQTYDQAKEWAKGTGWFWRDVLTAAANGNLLIEPGALKVTTPTFYVQQTIANPLVANTPEIVNFDTFRWDNNVFWTPTVAPSKVVFRAPGLYLIGSYALFDNTATDKSVDTWMRLNGTDLFPQSRAQDISNNDITPQFMTIWYFHEGDYIELRVQSTFATSVLVSNMWGVAITPEALI